MTMRSCLLPALSAFMFALPPGGTARAAEPAVGPSVLFIGNSLTGTMDENLNAMAETNGLPKLNAHRIQIWNETFKTHVLANPNDMPKLFTGKGIAHELQKAGFRISGETTLWKKGIYDQPKFAELGFVPALDAIALGTPDGKPWEIVVLQGYSDTEKGDNRIERGAGGGWVVEGDFTIYGKQLVEAAKAKGAKVYFYMQWLTDPVKTKSDPLDAESYYGKGFANTLANYKALSMALDVPIIPCGHIAHKLISTEKPEGVASNWIYGDSLHASGVGTALLQYAIGSALWGRPATALAYQFDPGDNKWKQGKRYVIGQESPAMRDTVKTLITPEIDRHIRQVVADTMAEYGWQLK